MIHKKLITSITTTAVVFSLIIAGCDSDSIGDDDADLESNIDSVSYSFGYNVGQQMGTQGMDDLETEAFAEGMQTALDEDSSAISQTEMMAIVQRYQMQAQQKMKQQQQEDAEKNKQEGQAFLEKNKEEEGVQTTESGLQYRVLEEGEGLSPTAKDTVVVNYTGTLMDGTEFDSGEKVEIPLNRVIKGWTEGMQLMQEGATYKFWIPGELAYGPNPRPGGPIGPNELLIFEVDLLDVKNTQE